MKVVYVGDCGVDNYSGKLYPGGCALNVAFYANQAGLNIDLISCLGDDEAAKIPFSICQKIGLTTDYIHILSGDTPKQKIQVLANGEKKFIGYYPGVLNDFNLNKEDISFVNQHDVVATLFYNQISHLFQQVTSLNFPGTKIIDFMDGADFNKDINFVKKYINQWDIGFFGLSAEDSSLIKDLIQLAKNNSKLIVITLGSGGSLAVFQAKIYKQKFKPIKPIDTTGCGDAYLAGFLANWLKDKDIQAAMKFGSELAATAAKHLGAINPKMG